MTEAVRFQLPGLHGASVKQCYSPAQRELQGPAMRRWDSWWEATLAGLGPGRD